MADPTTGPPSCTAAFFATLVTSPVPLRFVWRPPFVRSRVLLALPCRNGLILSASRGLIANRRGGVTRARSCAAVRPKRVGVRALPESGRNCPAPGCPFGTLSNCAATCRPKATLAALFLRVFGLFCFLALLLVPFLFLVVARGLRCDALLPNWSQCAVTRNLLLIHNL